MPRISVIIACYNHGAYLDEAVDSVLRQTTRDFEIVIVDDGSTDPATVEKLRNYARPKTQIIRTPNQGLPVARNTGISQSRGAYVLPLDADDRIAETYLEKAAGVLDESPQTGIVYCETELFGAQSGHWDLPPYSLEQMLLKNVIFCSAMFRKDDWARVGGYKPAMKYTWSDWELWLSLLELGREVYQIPETLFYYRRHPSSMSRDVWRHPEQIRYSYRQLVLHHRRLYAENVVTLFQNRWALAGNEDLVPRLVLPLLGARGDLRGVPARAAAMLGLLAWTAAGPLRRAVRARSPMKSAA